VGRAVGAHTGILDALELGARSGEALLNVNGTAGGGRAGSCGADEL